MTWMSSIKLVVKQLNVKFMSLHVYGIIQEELESAGFEILMIPYY